MGILIAPFVNRRPRHSGRVFSLVLLLALASCGAATESDFSSFDVADVAETEDDASVGEAVPEPTTSVSHEPTDSDPNCANDSFDPSLADEASAAGGSYVESIRSRGTLRVGVADDTLQFGSLNPGTGEIEGFDIELARLVAEQIFGNRNSIELIPISSAQRIPKLRDGSLDIVVKTMTITCPRWRLVNFSSVYYEARQLVLVAKGSEVETVTQMSGMRICASAGTTSIEKILELADEGVIAIAGSGWTDCLVKFQKGEVDGISTDDTILAGLAKQDPLVAQVVDSVVLSSEPYGIATPYQLDGFSDQEMADFTRYVNAVLEQARSGGAEQTDADSGAGWQQLYDEWLSDLLGPSTPPPAVYEN